MNIQVRIKVPGGPEQLEASNCLPQQPGPGEIRLRQRAIGVNFLDIYHRSGRYPLPSPCIPGVEGAGVVEALGAGVEGIRVGDRVVYAGVPGAYASTRLLPASRAVRLPEEIPFEVAATSMLRGLTARKTLDLPSGIDQGQHQVQHLIGDRRGHDQGSQSGDGEPHDPVLGLGVPGQEHQSRGNRPRAQNRDGRD